jgi:tripartite-type tricarboxylate transporter receptor subunit TctC
MFNRRDVVVGAGATALTAGAGSLPALAQQDWPNRPMHVYIGFAAGSGADILCRWFTTKLQDVSGQTVVIENRPGAVGSIAINVAAKSKPDGYSILFTGNTLMAGGRHLLKDFAVDYRRDFDCVCGLVETPFVLVVGSKSSVNSPKELIALLKSKQQNRYGYTNPAAMVAGYALKAYAGVPAEAISYRTTADAMGDLESATLDYMIMDGTFAIGQSKAGKLRILGATMEKRINALPDVPTMQEGGVPDFFFSPWWAVWLPKGSPANANAKLGDWVQQVGKMPETVKFLDGMVAMPVIGDAKFVLDKLDADKARWDKLAVAAGLTPQ